MKKKVFSLSHLAFYDLLMLRQVLKLFCYEILMNCILLLTVDSFMITVYEAYRMDSRQKRHPVAAVKSSVELWCVERSKISMEEKGNEIIKVWKWTCAIFHIIIISFLVRWRRRRSVRAYRDFSFPSPSSSFLIASNNNLWLDVNFNMNWLWLTFPLYLDWRDHFRLVYLALLLPLVGDQTS